MFTSPSYLSYLVPAYVKHGIYNIVCPVLVGLHGHFVNCHLRHSVYPDCLSFVYNMNLLSVFIHLLTVSSFSENGFKCSLIICSNYPVIFFFLTIISYVTSDNLYRNSSSLKLGLSCLKYSHNLSICLLKLI